MNLRGLAKRILYVFLTYVLPCLFVTILVIGLWNEVDFLTALSAFAVIGILLYRIMKLETRINEMNDRENTNK